MYSVDIFMIHPEGDFQEYLNIKSWISDKNYNLEGEKKNSKNPRSHLSDSLISPSESWDLEINTSEGLARGHVTSFCKAMTRNQVSWV